MFTNIWNFFFAPCGHSWRHSSITIIGGGTKTTRCNKCGDESPFIN